VTLSSRMVMNMKNNYSFQKRTFLNPVSTNTTSHILAYVENSRDGENKWGGNFLIIADCSHSIEFEFCLGNARYRHLSLKKINLLIDTLTQFRDALAKEIALIEKGD
jgi:hypothetical protein